MPNPYFANNPRTQDTRFMALTSKIRPRILSQRSNIVPEKSSRFKDDPEKAQAFMKDDVDDSESSQDSMLDKGRTSSGEYLAPYRMLGTSLKIICFHEGYTLAQHFDFIAKRIGLASPKDDQEIAQRLGFCYHQTTFYAAHTVEPMLEHVRRDRGVRRLRESCNQKEELGISLERHPVRCPYTKYGTDGTWLVIFSAPSYKVKKHFKKIGISFPVTEFEKEDRYIAAMTEEQLYIVLSDRMVGTVRENPAERLL